MEYLHQLGKSLSPTQLTQKWLNTCSLNFFVVPDKHNHGVFFPRDPKLYFDITLNTQRLEMGTRL